MPQQNWKALQKKILEKAEKGDNQHRGKKNKQDLETTRRSYATHRLKSSAYRYSLAQYQIILSLRHSDLSNQVSVFILSL